MTDYVFKYQLASAPAATNDGSGMVMHDIFAIAQPEGNGDEWQPIRHKTVAVPFEDLDAMLAQPSNPTKVTAYKNALTANLNSIPVPITGWNKTQLEAFMDANDESAATVVLVRNFIEVTMGLNYPITFAM